MLTTSGMKVPDELRRKLEKLTPFARKYAEYRAKGLKQADAAKKAGSNASDRSSLSRVGWNTEQMDGVKDYILFLEERRATAAVVEDLEIIEKLRTAYDEAIANGKYSDAVKACELLGNMIGAFNAAKAKTSAPISKADGNKEQADAATPKNNTGVFQQDMEDEPIKDRVARLYRMTTDQK